MGRIVMKWGGGLITDKSSLCSVQTKRIQELANVIHEIHDMGHDIIIVHGAGSFGHIRAREYRLAEGNIAGLEQEDAIKLVRRDMDTLHKHVIKSLEPLKVYSHPPRDFVTNTGEKFNGDLIRFLAPGVHVTFGDVVECDAPAKFGILSGDDLMLRLSIELPDVICTIFAMGGTAGVMTDTGPDATLIPRINANTEFAGFHDTEIDVTGGIFLKVERAFEIANTVDQVWFIDGHYPNRIIDILSTGDSTGTRICPE